jgi:hypothetical protein
LKVEIGKFLILGSQVHEVYAEDESLGSQQNPKLVRGSREEVKE